tara:strand:- start:213 stop:446 length:234 start_codon:yes stop_codon:yes gene_type:complete
MKIIPDIELDLCGLACPMPLLKAKLALNSMKKEQVLKVIATDSASERDFHMFVKQTENEILDFKKDNQAYSYWIKKG